MKFKRIAAAGLACAVLMSLPATALAVRKGSGGPKAAGMLDPAQIVPAVSGSLSFDGIENQVRRGNPNVKAAQEGLAQVKAMNWNRALSDLEDNIDELESGITLRTASAAASISGAAYSISQAMVLAQDAEQAQEAAELMVGGISAVSTGTYLSAQAESLNSTLEALEEQRDDLIKQRDKYPKTIEDTERMVQSTTDQIVAGAETLYLTILSTELQYESLQDRTTAMARTVEEMELRHELGQISAQTLLQIQNGYTTMTNSLSGLETTLQTLRASLQSLLGEVPDGNLTLTDTPKVTQAELDAILYDSDLAKAKEKSYSLYSAARSVEKAREEMEDARKDNGKSSYQYQMAEHAYQSAVYQEASAIASFELSFQVLYQALAPAQSALAVKAAELTYQEQACAAAELKYQQGNISANALQEAVNARESARRDVASAKLDLFIAYHSYRQAVDKGLVNSGS